MRRGVASFGRALALGAACAASGALLTGCETTTSGGAVGAERKQLLLISSEELNRASAQGYAKLKAEAAAKGILNTDRALLARVTAITNRLTPQTRTFREDAPGWNWEVNVISSSQVNAFVMPGGKIMVYSGIVNQLKLSDDELAFVIGHEMAHALREHSREHISQAAAAQTAIGLGAALLGLGGGAANLANLGYEAFVATRFSRGDESEADRIGVELAARAGYDPRASVAVWQKMAAASTGSGSPEFLSTHPTDATRTQALQALLPKVMPLYEASRRR